MKLRKMTFEVYVDQDSKDWHWLFDTLKMGEITFKNGFCARSSSEGWTSEEVRDALIYVNNHGVHERKVTNE